MADKTHHPLIPELKAQMERGGLSRRDFLRYATLLGLSATVAGRMAGLVLPREVWAGSIRRGGILKVSSQVHKVTHPAQFSWIAPANQLRHVAEYLTLTDSDNITHPYLLEKWEASEDLKTWTLHLRKGVKFNNGDPFTADDVVFTLDQWLNKDVASSMLGLMSGYLDPTGIEKVNAHQVRLHLKRPEIAVPEHLFHYPALVLNHRTFEGDFIKNPHGTGPYTLVEYREGERCVLKARSDYWQKGADGKPLPYLDGMEFIDMGGEMAPHIAAIKTGEVDVIDPGDMGGTDIFLALKDDPNIRVLPVTTGQVRVLRMRVDIKPWTDNRVRQALKLCQNREKILALAYHNQGLLGQDFHIYPKHPEYCAKPIPKYDPDRARELLKQAGYPNGLDVNLAVGSDWSDVVRYAEILKEDAAPAGFRIHIQTMPASQYWEKWTEVDLGITPWTHRPLGTMVLNLGYVADDEGKPVPWNETRWVDKEFCDLVAKASGILDVEERRKVFCILEEIMMERGPVGISYWRNVWTSARTWVHNLKAHPTNYLLTHEVWLSKRTS
ncbi:MAG: diguanylate cyclase [Desulfacinum sp.]|jgi:peptide/nickel transport system substrate-binding protein|nr:diguanylate cyclase [Desulfacinum sp.]